MNWLDKLKDYAPSIAAAIFSGGATLPQLAAQMISDATGVKVSTVAEAEKVINAATPDQLLAIKKVDNDFKIQMATLELGAIVELSKTQNKVNEIEAQSPSILKSGWRPAVGWVCVAGISWQYVLFPMLSFFLPVFSVEFTLPTLPEDRMLELLFGMLGLGGLRTYEKLKGKAV